jgi:tetratricopeptide (TPR) repeat protein
MSKKNFQFLFFVMLTILGTFHCLADSQDKLFYDAVRAEASGDLDRALEIYSEIAQTYHSANLHANIANLYLDIEDYARSVLHFRKAIWLAPDNREYFENLNFALEMSHVPKKEIHTHKPYFSARYQTKWLMAFTMFFWGGMILAVLLAHRMVNKPQIITSSTLWLSCLAFLAWGWSQSFENSTKLNREVIAVNSLNGNDKGLPLRVFAGKGSQANTTVPLGASLFLDLSKEGLVKVHQSPTGEKWFLARSKSGKDKGWLQRSEFEPILDLEL